jgi:hypothetical protein
VQPSSRDVVPLGSKTLTHLGRMAFEFVTAVVELNFSAALKFLDAATKQIKENEPNDSQGLAQICLNRGYCNQRLQLYRKALKVGGLANHTCSTKRYALAGLW